MPRISEAQSPGRRSRATTRYRPRLCHARPTYSASTALRLKPAPRLARRTRAVLIELAAASSDSREPSVLGQQRHFFLNLSMATCKAMLDAAQGVKGSSLVTAMTRNGVRFGIRLSGTGDAWFALMRCQWTACTFQATGQRMPPTTSGIRPNGGRWRICHGDRASDCSIRRWHPQ